MDFLIFRTLRQNLKKSLLVFIITFSVLLGLYFGLEDNILNSAQSLGNKLILKIYNFETETKMFVKEQDLYIYFRYDINPENPQFSYISTDFRSHFALPIIIFFALTIATPIPIQRKILMILIGCVLLTLFANFKFWIAGIDHLAREIIFDNNGNMVDVGEYKYQLAIIPNFFNKLFNQYGAIGLRPIATILIWGILTFLMSNIKNENQNHKIISKKSISKKIKSK